MLRLLVGESIAVEYLLAPTSMLVRADPTQISQILVNLASTAYPVKVESQKWCTYFGCSGIPAEKARDVPRMGGK